MKRIDKKFPILYEKRPLVDGATGEIIRFREPFFNDDDYYYVVKTELDAYRHETIPQKEARTFRDKQGNLRLAPRHRDNDIEKHALFVLGILCLILGLAGIVTLILRSR